MAEVETRPRPDIDPIWTSLRTDAAKAAEEEPALASVMHAAVLGHGTLEEALSYKLGHRLGSEMMTSLSLRQSIDQALSQAPEIGSAVRADLAAVMDRDPACTSYLETFLYFKGFAAIQAHRIAHWLWNQDRKAMAFFIQSRISEIFAVDIHPAAPIGRGILMDHATGVVIGETAVIEDEVSIMQGVTLGGTGKHGGDRHPKVRHGALIGAGATILGNIEVGEDSRVGAGAVVLKHVPRCKTVAGVPAVVVGDAGCEHPSLSMNQNFWNDPQI